MLDRRRHRSGEGAPHTRRDGPVVRRSYADQGAPIRVDGATVYSGFMRVNAPGQFGGGFIEVPLEATDIAIGNPATVECTRQGRRLVAMKVALADPYDPNSGPR